MNGVSGRDIAFLAEMGIGPLWQLRAPVAAEPQAPHAAEDEAAVEAQAGPAAVQAPSVAASLPPPPAPMRVAPPVAAWAPAPVAPKLEAIDEAAIAIASMDWAELRAAITDCTRCSACREGSKKVLGAGAREAAWFVAAGAASAADEAAGEPLAGEAGKLLDNMLLAVEHSRETDVYVTNLIKCRPAGPNGADRAPTAEQAAACRPYLERELALTGAATMLSLGQIAANALLGKPLQAPLAGARGSVHEVNGVPLVATLHPGELLLRGADKALAWADLCRAKAAHARSG
jgi:DNA polymerase